MSSLHIPIYRTGIGQDSHRFLSTNSSKPCILGGVVFEEEAGFSADSDGDVVLHAICNAITSLTGVHILGAIAKDLCHKDGITDSQVYLEKALEILQKQKIIHVALTIEAKRPRLQSKIDFIRKNIAEIMHLTPSQVGLSCTSGEGLTDFGCGDGVQCICLITTREEI